MAVSDFLFSIFFLGGGFWRLGVGSREVVGGGGGRGRGKGERGRERERGGNDMVLYAAGRHTATRMRERGRE